MWFNLLSNSFTLGFDISLHPHKKARFRGPSYGSGSLCFEMIASLSW